MLGRCSTAAADWCWLTAEEAEAGLLDADVLAVRWWWLKERRSTGKNGCGLSICW